jgi:hypothetical protein
MEEAAVIKPASCLQSCWRQGSRMAGRRSIDLEALELRQKDRVGEVEVRLVYSSLRSKTKGRLEIVLG